MNIAGLADVLHSERCVLFLGSGVSMSAPSGLPSAARIMESFLGRIADGILTTEMLEELLSRGLLPEFVYGLCERYFGPQVYNVWGGLGIWRSRPRVFSANVSHLAAVHIAVMSGTPILTPNYDEFLEDAAERLRVRARVSIAHPAQRWSAVEASPGEVAIWKLHGSLGSVETLFSSVKTLTRPALHLTAPLQQVEKDARLILAGYSGRDLDLFSPISRIRRTRQPVWVDRRFDQEHRATLLQPAPLRVTASFEAVAREYAARSCDQVLSGAILDVDRRAARKSWDQSREWMLRRIDQRISAVAGGLDDDARRRLILAELLINAGISSAVEGVLGVSAAFQGLEVIRARLRAKALWEMGLFEDSYRVAADGLRNAASGAERDLLRFSQAVATVRAEVAPAGLQGVAPISREVALRHACQALRVLLAALPRYIRRRQLTEPIRTDFTEGFLEHVIRILLGAQLASWKLTQRFRSPRRALIAAWRLTYRECVANAYAEGLGNVNRYLDRLAEPTTGRAEGAHDFLGHRLGVVIALRDQASRLSQAGDVRGARRVMRLALSLGRQQSDPVLSLTLQVAASSLGLTIRVPDRAVASIQARWAAQHLIWRRNNRLRAR